MTFDWCRTDGCVAEKGFLLPGGAPHAVEPQPLPGSGALGRKLYSLSSYHQPGVRGLPPRGMAKSRRGQVGELTLCSQGNSLQPLLFVFKDSGSLKLSLVIIRTVCIRHRLAYVH